ncbi:MAG TPA: LysR family transcriptional regulator [Steroidobacteraceae bacterium]|nr:LysR family transcriptional regulator [Steroidobacteraceae bacterium]
MNLEELRTFLEVIEQRSLVAASRRLNVTQSTVTARLNALEEEIGQKLLHRSKGGAELTSAGFKFQRYAEVMVQLWRQARYEVSLPKGFEGVCSVGLEFDLWRRVGQRFLDRVRRRSPKIAVALWPAEQQQLDRWLKIGLVDLAFCYRPQAGEGFASRVLIDDELILVSTIRGAAATLDDSYVYVDHGDEFRRQHAAAFPSETTSAVTLASSDWAIDHLLQNGGSGYLSRRHASPYLKRGRLHVVGHAPSFKRRIYLVESAQTVSQWPWYESAIAALMSA